MVLESLFGDMTLNAYFGMWVVVITALLAFIGVPYVLWIGMAALVVLTIIKPIPMEKAVKRGNGE